MQVTFFGTRGSVPISNKDSVETGGNTTCLRINSSCLPEGMWLVVDAGSGFVPLCGQALKEGIKSIHLLFTHYHWDHTQGLPLGPLTFIKPIPFTCWGPVDEKLGPKAVLLNTMKRPFFPVDFAEVGSHFHFKDIEHPNTQVILIHPKGGVKQMPVDQFEAFNGKPLPFKEGKFPKNECLVIRMMRSYHPEMTITYRFEEGPTGKVFVFMTDHENQAGTPLATKNFLNGADLLVMDSQYTQEKYLSQTAGFGHGTPEYCIRVANEVNARRLGLTHHDPMSTDKDVANILAAAKRALSDLGAAKGKLPLKADNVFACRDYLVVNV